MLLLLNITHDNGIAATKLDEDGSNCQWIKLGQ